MDIYSIYRATNIINGKVYIGYTSNLPQRLQRHKKDSLTTDTKFYRAIRKYGWDNFIFEIIYQSKDKEYTKNTMESEFIIEYDSLNSGYNSKKGGDGGWDFIHSNQEYFNKKNQEWWNSLSDEERETINKKKARHGSANGSYNKKFSYERIQNISAGVNAYYENLSQEEKDKLGSQNVGKATYKNKLTGEYIGQVETTHPKVISGEWIGINTGIKHSEEALANHRRAKAHLHPPSPKGKLWWNNGVLQARSIIKPDGTEWVRGRLKVNK